MFWNWHNPRGGEGGGGEFFRGGNVAIQGNHFGEKKKDFFLTKSPTGEKSASLFGEEKLFGGLGISLKRKRER